MRATIDQAVLACLPAALSAPDPHAFVTRFIERLSAHPGWTPEEVEEVLFRIREQLPAPPSPDVPK